MTRPSTQRAAHLAVAGVAGLVVTVLEFGAVRFMAPSFGQSNYVWSNVVGMILLALALGYALGGRVADRSRTARPLYLAYVLAALWAVLVAVVGRDLCAALVPTEVGNARLLPLAFTGSLAATVVLFAPPVLVLGMTSPFLVRLDDRPGFTGRTAGRVFAIGTLGSLAGCYLAPLWLLQAIGSRATILSCAAALAALGVLGLLFGGARTKAGAAVAAVVLAAALSLAVFERPLLRHDAGQLVEVETAYQTIRVVEADGPLLVEGDWPYYGELRQVPTRFLRHDEDVEAYQSVVLWPPSETQRYLTGGRYYDHLALGAWFAGQPKDHLRVLVIGYAGGSVHRVLEASKPPGTTLDVLGVEIDPGVVQAARRYLALGDLESEHLRLYVDVDGRTVLNALPDDEVFDLVLVDAYARTAYVPFQLASVEAFSAMARHLAPHGWIGLNLHAEGGLDGRLARSMATTMAAAKGLGDVWISPDPLYPGSLALWCAHDGSGAPRVRGDVPLPAPLRTPALALERLLVRHDPDRDGGHVMTDDKSDADRLGDEGPLP